MRDVCVKGCSIGTGIPKICVPIVARNMREIFSQARATDSKKFDIVEWRVDWFDDFENLNEIRRASRVLHGILGERPILFTFRTPPEGGRHAIDPDYYFELNRVAVEEHLADMIDLELFAGDDKIRELIDYAHKKNSYVIISSHDFEKTPPQEELVRRLRHAEELGADILKTSVMPQNSRDVLELLSATEQMHRESDRPVVTMAMGKLGIISRLSGEIFGSAMTFGTIGYASAPGQISIGPLREVLQLLHK